VKSILNAAGHSTVAPRDPGAVSRDGSLVEAKLAVRMRDAVSAICRYRGLQVFEDGEDGVSQQLTKAIALCRQNNGRAVEFHFNASVNPSANGIEALSLGSNSAFAKELAQAVAKVTGAKLRGVNGWLDQSKGQHHRLGFCVAGGVILELAFISNPSEMAIYLEKEKEIAVAVADVMCKKAGWSPVTGKGLFGLTEPDLSFLDANPFADFSLEFPENDLAETVEKTYNGTSDDEAPQFKFSDFFPLKHLAARVGISFASLTTFWGTLGFGYKAAIVGAIIVSVYLVYTYRDFLVHLFHKLVEKTKEEGL
jgi:N-acetylmuramoyl-L-alanine amidase